jgi:hypothetical protein
MECHRGILMRFMAAVVTDEHLERQCTNLVGKMLQPRPPLTGIVPHPSLYPVL